MWVSKKVREDIEVKIGVASLHWYDRFKIHTRGFGRSACFGVRVLSILWPVLIFWGEKNQSVLSAVEKPQPALHVEDVGVAVKCSFPPTNVCINLTHSYHTPFLCHVCSVALKQCNSMQISWNICLGSTYISMLLHCSYKALWTCLSCMSTIIQNTYLIWQIYHFESLQPPVLWVFVLHCIDFAAKICLWPSMQLLNSRWIITQRLDAHRLHVFLFFPPGSLQLSASLLNDQSILCW